MDYLHLKVERNWGDNRSVMYLVSDKFQRGLESGSDKVKRFTRSIRSCYLKKFLADDEVSRKKILDPQGSFLQKWNKIFVLSCVITVSLDPLFFYIPIVDDEKKCLDLDPKLEATASILRSFTDLFYLSHIVFQFRAGFIAPSSRVFGRGVLIEDSWEIVKRYLSSYFIIDILAVLPLPHVRKNSNEHSHYKLVASLSVAAGYYLDYHSEIEWCDIIAYKESVKICGDLTIYTEGSLNLSFV